MPAKKPPTTPITLSDRPAVLAMGSMGGEPMTPGQIASALQSAPDHPALRGVIQAMEAYAVESQQLAMSEMLMKQGMASHYLMAQSFLTNLLLDVRDYRAGRVPDQPLGSRVQPKHRQSDN